MSQADLEISVFHRSAADYGVTLRFLHPAAGQDKSASGSLALDEAALGQRQHDPSAYGELLAAQIFAGEGVRGFLDQALAVAASQQTPLHLRLFIHPDAAALHALRWETLRLPGRAAPLAVGDEMRFSRYLDSADWRPAHTAERDALAALVAVASPDVSGTTLAEVRTDDELNAARAGLGDIPCETLAGRGQVTLNALLARLRDGCDILYLVAHGMLVEGEPQILLEAADGGRAWTSGRELVARLRELAQPPSLVVLASCQSAGTGEAPSAGQDGGALAGLGPRLAAAGVPAVVAMQGNVSMATTAAFMRVFLRELRRDGVVDRAMAVARGAVRERPDWWMPVLYSRLKDGRVFKLPNAADDPLFGLPALPPLDLPDKPYRYLDWYRREDAEIFFGRGKEIRDLYDSVTSPAGDPILLLYGQSGVGKSSVLAAGLRPRLEASHEVRYMRRDQEKGLLGTLAAGLPMEPDDDLASAWRRLEAQCNKPLLVVLDQVEEYFTRPNPEQPGELADFLDALQKLFGDAGARPRGRLILGFRKEWLAEIDKRLAERALPRVGVFLERLGRAGIAEVVAGPTFRPRLRSRYGLSVADALPDMIADDLLADRESPVAPMLAILLADMWDAAKSRSYDRPAFDEELYHEYRTRGLSLNDFLGRQLGALRHDLPDVVDSGLALDVLAYHTTPLGTAEQRTLADLEQTYSHRQDVLPGLVQQCQDLYLLVDPAKNLPGQPPASRLTHDTLAPHVRKRFDESNAPGQRARRILESRLPPTQEHESPHDHRDLAPLGDEDMDAVIAGQPGMRVWKAREQQLVVASSTDRARRLEEKTRVAQERERARQRELQHAQAMAKQESKAAMRLRFLVVILTALTLVLPVSWLRQEILKRQARTSQTYFPGYELITPESSASQPVPGFFLDRYEVSNQQYRLCVASGACEPPVDPIPERYKSAELADYPVTYVTAFQADTYCRWLGRRLPTSSEWQQAVQVGGKKPWPWGDTIDASRVNMSFDGSVSRGPSPVDSYPAGRTPEGLFHMIGNVWEWTSTAADNDFAAAEQERQKPLTTRADVSLLSVRGGSYVEYAHDQAWVTEVIRFSPNHAAPYLGFRCARD